MIIIVPYLSPRTCNLFGSDLTWALSFSLSLKKPRRGFAELGGLVSRAAP